LKNKEQINKGNIIFLAYLKLFLKDYYENARVSRIYLLRYSVLKLK